MHTDSRHRWRTCPEDSGDVHHCISLHVLRPRVTKMPFSTGSALSSWIPDGGPQRIGAWRHAVGEFLMGGGGYLGQMGRRESQLYIAVGFRTVQA